MSFSDWLLQTKPIMPVIALDSVDQAQPLAESLIEGGINFLEITLRTPAALAAIEQLRKTVPDAIVGVGTVTTQSQMLSALDAGAQFAISPGINATLCDCAKKHALPYLPGVMTPSDILTGLECGYDQFKFFPAEQAGGISMLKTLMGPFPQLRFCPTGGINAENARSYLALSNVNMVGGTWLAPRSLIQEGEWLKITELAKEFSCA